MKIKSILPSLVIAAGLASSAMAQALSSRQVTGQVVEVTDSKIVIQKGKEGKEKWEIARTPSTKVTGDLKVGDRVTIQYSMTASAVELKPLKEKKADKKDSAAPSSTPAAPATPEAKKSA